MGRNTYAVIAYGLCWEAGTEPPALASWREGYGHDLGVEGWIADRFGINVPPDDTALVPPRKSIEQPFTDDEWEIVCAAYAAWDDYQGRVRELFRRLRVTADTFGHTVQPDRSILVVYATDSEIYASPDHARRVKALPPVQDAWTADLQRFCRMMRIDWSTQGARLGWWLVTYADWMRPIPDPR